MFSTLIAETPFLVGGYLTNLLIAAVSMALGTVLGIGLGRGRAGSGFRRQSANLLTNVCRNVPSFILLFYIAFLLPPEIAVGSRLIEVPTWIKAALALTIPVIGFASDQYLGYLTQRQQGLSGARSTFVAAWLQYFLIIIMATATASVIGADEIVGRTNTLIARDGSSAFLLIAYSYVSLWFLTTGLVLSAIVSRIFTSHEAAGKQ